MNRWKLFTTLAVVVLMFIASGKQTVTAQDESSNTSTEVQQQAPDNAPPPGDAAQDTQARPGRRGNMQRPGDQQGQRRQFDPSRWMDRMIERYKEDLGASEEEWKVLEPMVKKVAEAQMSTRMRGFGRRGGDGGPSNPTMDALRATVDNDKSTPEEIKAKLQAYRDAQKKDADALKAAQDELRKVLTVKQEAKMVLSGLLD